MSVLQGGVSPSVFRRHLHTAGCPRAQQVLQLPHQHVRSMLHPALALRRWALAPGVHQARCLGSAARAMAKKKEEDSPYKNTVNLPQTKFNMRANSKQREPELQKFWDKERVYERLCQENSGGTFTLHDGPPYANGDLHCGHALNKILKDIINRFQLLQGKKAKYVPGWDCHGLPIELKVLQAMKEEERRGLDPIKLRRKARDFANKTVKAQRAQFQRFGVWADWQSPYLTLDAAYEAAQLRVFGQMVANGHIYRGRKPVHWSPSSQTALAESELEYPDGHTSRSIYVGMPLVRLGEKVPEGARDHLEGASLAIWTTTPWTLPANAAVAVNADLRYCVAQVEGSGSRYVIAEDLLEQLQGTLGLQLTQLDAFPGSALEGCEYRHPLATQEAALDRTSPVVIGGDYITTDAGTGLVHTAPGHGLEDYQVGVQYGLPTTSPVDDAGAFTMEAGPSFQGKPVLGDGNTAVLEALSKTNNLLKEESYGHRYPYDWRTKQPVIFRATEQWFASVDGFKDKALAAINEVRWFPATGISRITAMTAGRSDWCISRQRKWGVPIPVFYDRNTGEALMSQEIIEHIAQVVEQKGSDVWWQADVEALLPESLKSRAGQLRKGLDTMDVWFDSGSSWAACVQADEALNYPADLYLEGSDQHRGWFQSSLLTSVAVNGHAPYRNVLTHGFVLDEKGMKMSKSLGNTQDPLAIIEGGKDAKKEPAFGADVLRLWVASVDFQGDVLIGPNIIAQVSDVYKKFRFTLRFLLGNLHDFDVIADAVDFEALPLADRYMLHRLGKLLDDVKTSYGGFQFYRTYQALQRFAVQELSNFYLDIAKDRLYVSGSTSHERRSCQTVLAAITKGLLASLAPMLPHLAEDAWQNLPQSFTGGRASVFQAGWQSPHAAWQGISEEHVATAGSLKLIRDHVNAVLEKARQAKLLGSSLEARVFLYVEDEQLRSNLRSWNQQPNTADPLRFMFIVSQAELVECAEDVEQHAEHSAAAEELFNGKKVVAGVTRADGTKCQRCWNYSTRVSEDSEHSALCERCAPVIRDMGFQLPKPASSLAA